MQETSSSQIESNENDINRICLKSKNYFSHLNDPTEIRKAKIEALRSQCLSKQLEKNGSNTNIQCLGLLHGGKDSGKIKDNVRPDGDPMKHKSECSEIIIDVSEDSKQLNDVKILKRKHFSIVDNHRNKPRGDHELDDNSDSPQIMSAISGDELSSKIDSIITTAHTENHGANNVKFSANSQKGDFPNLRKTNLSELANNKRYIRKAALQISLKKCLAELESLRTKNTNLENECEKMRENQNKIDNLRTENRELKETNEILEGRINELLAILESKTKEITEKDKQTISKELAMEILQREIINIQKEKLSLQEELKKKHEEIKDTLKLRALDIRKDIEMKGLHNQLVDSQGKIRVVARFRPESNSVFEYLNDDTVRINPSILTVDGKAKKIALNKIFVPEATQEDVFNDIRPYVTSAVDGYKVAIIAFGQVGTGKTHTMHGTSGNPGITGRLMEHILELKEKRTQWNYSLKISIIQVYNETVMDLLSSKVSFLTLTDDGADVKIKGITEKPLIYVEDMMGYIQIGRRRRTTSKTIFNSNSSKSHLIILLHIEGKSIIDNEVTNGLLTLCDLAGFEKQNECGNVSNSSINESKYIGKSLAGLSRVLQALQQSEKSIPFRDSKLTHVLKPSLTNDSKCVLILTLSTLEENLNGSLRTLNVGQKVSSLTSGQLIKFESSSPPIKQLKINEKSKLEKKERSLKVLYKFPLKSYSESS